MTERSLILFQEGIIPLKNGEQQTLTAKQKEDLIDATRTYVVRRLKISPTLQNLEKAAGVLGNAVSRALDEQGRPSLTPADRVKTLVKKGLEVREDIRRRAESLLNLSLTNQTDFREFLGPLALPKSLIRACNIELVNFPLTADIPASLQVATLGQQRLRQIDYIALIGLGYLPEPLRQNVTLVRFKPVERTSLIRNMIASYVFRNHLSPLISTSDLKTFVQGFKKSPLYFDEQNKEALYATLNLTDSGIRAFVSALYDQTGELFRLRQTFLDNISPDTIEQFYFWFSKDLLLLHPALEEAKIITQLDRLKEGTPSLWDDSISFGPIKIPNPESLAKALVQAEALHDIITTNRLREGIRTWHWFNQEIKKHQGKIDLAKKELAERQKLLQNLRIYPKLPLPEEAYFNRYKTQVETKRRAEASTREVRRLSHIIEESFAEQARTRSYRRFLTQRYGTKLPDQVPMLQSVSIRELESKSGSISVQLSQIRSQLRNIEDLLDLDLTRYKEIGPMVNRLNKTDAKARIESELLHTISLQRKFQKDPQSIPFDQEYLSQLTEHLNSRLPTPKTGSRKPLLPIQLKDYNRFWRDIKKNLGELRRKKNIKTEDKIEFWQELILQILEKRVDLLGYTFALDDKKQQLAEQSEQVRDQIRHSRQVTGRLVDDQTVWSKEEAEQFIIENEASALPSFIVLKETGQEEFTKVITNMRWAIANLQHEDLPETIPAASLMAARLIETINIHQHKVDLWKESKEKRRIKGLTARLHALKFLFENFNQPLIPIKEATGLSKEGFIRAWKKRIDLIQAICYRDEAYQESQQVQEAYENIMRATFLRMLVGELSSRKKAIRELSKRDIEREFVERMRPHGFVLKSNS